MPITMPPALNTRHQHARGFTLIEIMVVMLLVSIILAVAIPRFDSGVLQDSRKTTTRKFINLVSSLRSMAIADQKIYTLFIDIGNNRYWVADQAMDEIALAQANEAAFRLPGDIHFTDVDFPYQDKISTGHAEIRFHPAGFADQALIHLENDNGQRFTYMVEPLLPKLKTVDEWLQY